MKTFFAEHAWLGGESCASNVRITVDNSFFVSIDANSTPKPKDLRITGVVMPGFVNAHSHAFHRALRGRTQSGAGLGDFWSWRTLMYQIANRLTPENYLALATATFSEMALAGITTVGEFHYVHHQQNGKQYADPNEMGKVLIEAARRAGIRITLLDVAYLHAGLKDQQLAAEQLRFSDSSVENWLARVNALGAPSAMHSIGLAPHSVRAVHESELAYIAKHRNGRVVHIHVSEQPAENEACREATGRTPTQLLNDAQLLGSFATAVHATHLQSADIALLGHSKTFACFCPTTERDLADGIGPSDSLVRAGSPLCLGTDSHAVIDMFEEARAVEMNQRLITNRRGVHRSSELLSAATINGASSLGSKKHGFVAGAPADFISVATNSVRLASFDPENGAAHLVHSATSSDVSDVWVGGEQIVSNFKHRTLSNINESLRTAIEAVL
ncbi:MAG: formimidoylglutamate deiminase [Actinomycetota bacterium]|nr:formimidoylglutamate deiminase [Actinomycetota bacterium]